ncbi:MAG TPA: redoxin family protein [Candidatus Paceibacterota bacterium]|nr:redoxin family protein [Candidatus Paceibacterota bacterium]
MTSKRLSLIAALVVIGGLIVYLELGKVRPTLPPGGSDIPLDVALEHSMPEPTSTSVSATGTAPSSPPARITSKATQYARAKEFVDPTGFVNASDTLTIASLVGKKVILLDFWTYSCINCIRTQPYLNAWYNKYRDAGLEIIGVHTPEFDFEKDHGNVAAAVAREGIKYPVVQDNNYGTWTAYGNQYWPRKYLIDIDGYVVYDKIGEGGYDETEQAIQKALTERATVLGISTTIPTGFANPDLGADAPSASALSPETYFGAARNEYLSNGKSGVVGDQTLSLPSDITPSALYLGGPWRFEDQYAQNTATAVIRYEYEAQSVYFVASAADGVTAEVYRDGQPLPPELAGEDVKIVNGQATVVIKENRLYRLIHEAAPGTHTLELRIEQPGLQAFTFTFG